MFLSVSEMPHGILRTVLGGLVIALLVVACEPVLPPESTPEPRGEPEPAAPLPVVSFVTLYHSTTAGRMVLLTIKLSPPALRPVSIRFIGHFPPFPFDRAGRPLIREVSVTVPAGSSSAFIPVPIPYVPAMAGETHGTNILIEPGEGYIHGNPASHDLRVYYDPNYDPEPDPEYAKEPGPFVNKVDDRCPYSIGMAPVGTAYPVLLLDHVSSAGTLCATGTYNVRQSALDRVSRASTTMLQHRPDIAENLTGRYGFGEIILLYAESEEDWCNPPAFPEVYINALRWCDRLRFYLPIGTYSGSIILCPENNLRVCIHEIAHAVYFHLPWDPDSVDEREPVEERFNEPDVAVLWSGYAMEDEWEFFAEMTAVYFCVPTEATSPVLHCADELQAYDPKTYEVIHAIYRGSADLR